MAEDGSFPWWSLPFLCGILVLSGFFSMAETVFFALGPIERRKLLSRPGPGARALAACLQHPHSLLVTILVANLSVNVLYFASVSTLAGALARHGAAASAAVSLSGLVALVLLGEIVPKVFGVALARRLAPALAPFFVVLKAAFLPVRVVLEGVVSLVAPARQDGPGGGAPLSQEEIKELLHEQPDRFQLDRRAAAMIREVISLGDVKVREIMTPRVDMEGVDARLGLEEVRQHFRRHRLAWVVVFEGGTDRVLGALDARALFLKEGGGDLRSRVVTLVVVPEVARLDHLVWTFHEEGTTRALVVDEYGGTAGVVTLEQVVAEILGDLHVDGTEAPVRHVGEGVYHVDGSLPIREWNEIFGGDVIPDRFETVGGRVLSLLDRMPREGDVLEDVRFAFRVLRVRGRRIGLLEVRELQRVQR